MAAGQSDRLLQGNAQRAAAITDRRQYLLALIALKHLGLHQLSFGKKLWGQSLASSPWGQTLVTVPHPNEKALSEQPGTFQSYSSCCRTTCHHTRQEGGGKVILATPSYSSCHGEVKAGELVSYTGKTKAAEDTEATTLRRNRCFLESMYLRAAVIQGLRAAPFCTSKLLDVVLLCTDHISSTRRMKCTENDPTSAEPDESCKRQVQIIKLNHMVKTHFWAAFWQHPDQKILQSLYYARGADNLLQSNTRLAEQKICRRKNVSALIYVLKKEPWHVLNTG